MNTGEPHLQELYNMMNAHPACVQNVSNKQIHGNFAPAEAFEPNDQNNDINKNGSGGKSRDSGSASNTRNTTMPCSLFPPSQMPAFSPKQIGTRVLQGQASGVNMEPILCPPPIPSLKRHVNDRIAPKQSVNMIVPFPSRQGQSTIGRNSTSSAMSTQHPPKLRRGRGRPRLNKQKKNDRLPQPSNSKMTEVPGSHVLDVAGPSSISPMVNMGVNYDAKGTTKNKSQNKNPKVNTGVRKKRGKMTGTNSKSLKPVLDGRYKIQAQNNVNNLGRNNQLPPYTQQQQPHYQQQQYYQQKQQQQQQQQQQHYQQQKHQQNSYYANFLNDVSPGQSDKSRTMLPLPTMRNDTVTSAYSSGPLRPGFPKNEQVYSGSASASASTVASAFPLSSSFGISPDNCVNRNMSKQYFPGNVSYVHASHVEKPASSHHQHIKLGNSTGARWGTVQGQGKAASRRATVDSASTSQKGEGKEKKGAGRYKNTSASRVGIPMPPKRKKKTKESGKLSGRAPIRKQVSFAKQDHQINGKETPQSRNQLSTGQTHETAREPSASGREQQRLLSSRRIFPKKGSPLLGTLTAFNRNMQPPPLAKARAEGQDDFNAASGKEEEEEEEEEIARAILLLKKERENDLQNYEKLFEVATATDSATSDDLRATVKEAMDNDVKEGGCERCASSLYSTDTDVQGLYRCTEEGCMLNDDDGGRAGGLFG